MRQPGPLLPDIQKPRSSGKEDQTPNPQPERKQASAYQRMGSRVSDRGGELPNLLNKSLNSPSPINKIGPEIEQKEGKRRADISMDAKLDGKRLQRMDTNMSSLTKDMNGVSRIHEVAENDKREKEREEREEVEKKKAKSLGLDQKLELWNSIINQRKKLYKKMVQDINAGNVDGVDDEDYETERRNRNERAKEKKKAAQIAKEKGLLLESRIEINVVGNKESLSEIAVDAYKTPEDLLNFQISEIFNNKGVRPTGVGDLRNITDYITAFENTTKKKRNYDLTKKDLR